MRLLYRAGQRDTCTVRSQPVLIFASLPFIDSNVLFMLVNSLSGKKADGKIYICKVSKNVESY